MLLYSTLVLFTRNYEAKILKGLGLQDIITEIHTYVCTQKLVHNHTSLSKCARLVFIYL